MDTSGGGGGALDEQWTIGPFNIGGGGGGGE